MTTPLEVELRFKFQRTEGPPEMPDGDGWKLVEQTAGTCYSHQLGTNIGGLWLLWARPSAIPTGKA